MSLSWNGIYSDRDPNNLIWGIFIYFPKVVITVQQIQPMPFELVLGGFQASVEYTLLLYVLGAILEDISSTLFLVSDNFPSLNLQILEYKVIPSDQEHHLFLWRIIMFFFNKYWKK